MRLDKKRLPLLPAGILAAIVLLCLGQGLLPGGGIEMDPSAIDQAPSAAHLFGTDTLGRDVLTMILEGGRVSLFIGILAAAVSTLIACLYGTWAGMAGPGTDSLLMRISDMLMSLPQILLVLFLQAILGVASPVSIAVVIGISSWMPMAKMVRAQVRQSRTSGYILAARTMGAGRLWIFRKHLLPNFLPQIRFMIIMNIGEAIAQEATLSFLGLGLPLSRVSWGSMMSQARQVILTDSWWFLLIPGTVLILTLFCINEIAESVRVRTGRMYNNL